MARRVLITGASGFIGSYLVEEALNQGLEVFAGVRSSSRLDYLVNPTIQFVDLQLSSKEELVKTFRSFKQRYGDLDFIIHNAGITQARTSNEFFEVNYYGTQRLMEALTVCNMRVTKVVLISTLATYGPGDHVTFVPIRIGDVEKPISTYGRSKLMADQYLKGHVNFPYIILKPTAVYGPRDKDFLHLFKLISQGIELSVGRHRQMISLIYVKDLARVAVGLMLTSIESKTFLVSDGGSYSKGELNETIRAALKKKTIRVTLPLQPVRWTVKTIEYFYGRYGNKPFLNTEKLEEIIASNWLCDSQPVWDQLETKPKYSLDRGIEETFSWLKDNGWLR